MITHATLPTDISAQLEKMADNRNALSGLKREQIKEAIRLYHPRKSASNIARAFGVSVNYVCGLVREVQSERMEAKK